MPSPCSAQALRCTLTTETGHSETNINQSYSHSPRECLQWLFCPCAIQVSMAAEEKHVYHLLSQVNIKSSPYATELSRTLTSMSH